MNKDQEILRKITDVDLSLDPDTWQNSGFENHILAAQKETAIDFAEWADNNYYRLGNTNMWSPTLDGENAIRTEQLYEIWNNSNNQ